MPAAQAATRHARAPGCRRAEGRIRGAPDDGKDFRSRAAGVVVRRGTKCCPFFLLVFHTTRHIFPSFSSGLNSFSLPSGFFTFFSAFTPSLDHCVFYLTLPVLQLHYTLLLVQISIWPLPIITFSPWTCFFSSQEVNF